MNNMMNDYSTSDIENAKDSNIHVGSRIEWLDFVRSMAIVMVVFCHVTERAFNTRLK